MRTFTGMWHLTKSRSAPACNMVSEWHSLHGQDRSQQLPLTCTIISSSSHAGWLQVTLYILLLAY